MQAAASNRGALMPEFGFRVDKSTWPIVGLLVAQIIGGTVWVTKTDGRAAQMEQALAETKHDVYKLRVDVNDMRVALAALNGAIDTRQRTNNGNGNNGYGTSGP